METKYKFLEHKADAKFQAFGKTLNEQFQNAALAMTTIMTDDKIKLKITKTIKAKGIDKKNLLYNFLEELLFLSDTESFITSKAKVKITGLNLTAELQGDKIQNYKTKSDIKAVTYSEMKITKDYVQVVVDI